MTSSSAQSRTIRSIPMTAMWTLGTEVHIRPLPSFSTRQMEPVSATAKFTPEIADAGVQEDGPQPGLRVDGFGRMSASITSPASAVNRPGHRVAVVVDRRGDDVRRRLPCELDDELAEVGLDDLSTVGFEHLVEMDLLAGHRLALGHDPRVVRPDQVRR